MSQVILACKQFVNHFAKDHFLMKMLYVQKWNYKMINYYTGLSASPPKYVHILFRKHLV